MKLIVLIPAYNEESSIGEVISQIPKEFSHIDNVEVMVIDDGSSDKTASIAKEKGATVYSFSQNRGLAKAISHGFSKALQKDVDVLVILDADNQYDPREISLLVDPIFQNKADIVLGDRQVKKLDHMPFQKKIGNRMFSRVLSSLIGIKISDAQTGFRAFNREALTRLHIFSTYTYTQETLIQAKYKNLKILEVPVAFRKRDGKSRLISNIFNYGFRATSLVISTIIFYRSFKFFGILSLILFGIGTGLSVFILNHFYTTGHVAPYYPTTMLAILFLIIGSISALLTVVSTILNRQSILLEDIVKKLSKKSSTETEEDFSKK